MDAVSSQTQKVYPWYQAETHKDLMYMQYTLMHTVESQAWVWNAKTKNLWSKIYQDSLQKLNSEIPQ